MIGGDVFTYQCWKQWWLGGQQSDEVLIGQVNRRRMQRWKQGQGGRHSSL